MPSKRSSRLFYQIALRLAVVAGIFALLEIGLVIVMYVHDDETLAEDLVSLECARITGQLRETGLNGRARPLLSGSGTHAVAIFDRNGPAIIVENPGHLPLPEAPLPDVQSATSREIHGDRFFLTGIRREELDNRTIWIAVAISGKGWRPLLPALYKEVYDHALLPLIPLSILLFAFNAIVVRRMLEPLKRAVTEVDALDPSNPSHRLHEPDSPIEVRTLLRAVNRALDRLERAMSALRQFTADAAHELRTPLATMTLTIERLPPSTERARLGEDALSMTRLIGQMLELARTDTLDDMRGSVCDLDAMATAVAADLTPLALTHGLRVVYKNDGTALVRGRADILERALRNIIENAIWHSPGGANVEVTVGPLPQIQVRDHGPGIPAEIREQVFTRFWRKNRRGSGAGLGLAITRSIMEASGGRVSIGDGPWGGTVVTLIFESAGA